MRIVRFTPGPDAGLGPDPLFGVLEDDGFISVISGDPIYFGIQKTAARIELNKVRLLAPIIPRSKVVCIGKNYADHAAEMGGKVPAEPLIFLKPNTSVIGHSTQLFGLKCQNRLTMKLSSQLSLDEFVKMFPKKE
jgi:2-keto-4-pentenoate hydratase/2-oxohepta-3-ene-1,7-dioic acid hydratase in catechol pathway